MATKKKKRKATPAQLRALAKGRAALKKKRGKKRAKRTARGPTHAKARAALRGKAKAPKRRNPVRPMRVRGVVIARLTRPGRKEWTVQFWNGHKWMPRSDAAVYVNSKAALPVAKSTKVACGIVPAHWTTAQMKRALAGE